MKIHREVVKPTISYVALLQMYDFLEYYVIMKIWWKNNDSFFSTLSSTKKNCDEQNMMSVSCSVM